MNPDTIGCVEIGEFYFNTLRVEGVIFESGKKIFEYVRTGPERSFLFALFAVKE